MPMCLRDAKPVARKAHRCDCCTGRIEPGERYSRSTNIYDGRVYDFRSCAACESLVSEVWNWAGKPDEGVNCEDFIEWAQDQDESDGEHAAVARALLARADLAAEVTA